MSVQKLHDYTWMGQFQLYPLLNTLKIQSDLGEPVKKSYIFIAEKGSTPNESPNVIFLLLPFYFSLKVDREK